jgi:DNA-binding transcriptional MerR regulator
VSAVFRIGEFSRLTQVPVRTLRYYDARAVLRPARVSRTTGYRYYTAAQVAELNRLLAFQDLGFSLREIRTLLGERVTAPRMRRLLQRKREDVERRVREERARLARVAARLEALERCDHAAHEIAIRRVGPRLVATARDVLGSYDELDRLYDAIDRALAPRRITSAPRGAVWHATTGPIECEALVFLSAPVAPSPRVQVYEMPAHTAACLVYRGEDDYLRAYATLREWLASSGATVTGAKREIYLDEGGDGEAVTEIQYPITLREDTDA